MYAIIRRYKTTAAAEVAKRVEEEFVPLISKARGFLGYYVIDEGCGSMASISIFADREAAEYTNKLAADWVKDHPTALPEPPDITSGEVLLNR
ncbi:MAG: hypothetical protein OEZ59_04425 [Deltaproteobacteria bacterium]|nr:hypothetical protein [Deltaproteobacteria bacterium]